MRNILLLFGLAALLWSCGDQEDLNAQRAKDRQLIEEYLAENNLTATYDEERQIYHNITEVGEGGSPNTRSVVEVRYKGTLLDGTVFDETPGDATRELSLSTNVVEGWRRAIPMLQITGKGTFYIPSGLGYGQFGRPNIPPNAVLIFEIELVNFRG